MRHVFLKLVGAVSLACAFATPITVAADAAWSRQELTAFMRQLAGYVVDHHMRRDNSPMRGKVYEFYDPATRQQGYGGGWDTMHDGAFFANACILAYRATGDEFYLQTVRDWILPFYVRMANNSDTLFPDRTAAFSDGQKLPPERATAVKGFIPYWWDDGHGVNFDAIAQKMTIRQLLRDTSTITNDPENKQGILAGYSHGTSNHMALNMFPMWANAWLLTRDPAVAEAIHHLRQSRIHMIKMDLPWLQAADFQASGDAAQAQKVAGNFDTLPWPPAKSAWWQAMVAKKKTALTPFHDEAQGDYYGAVIGKRVGPGTAKRLTQLTYDVIRLQDRWYGDKPRPRGEMYGAETWPMVFITDGKFESLAGERPEVLLASRLGPQIMWACAQSLQLMRAFPDAWENWFKGKYERAPEGWSEQPAVEVTATLRRELEEGLRYWQKDWQARGYIRPHWPIGGKLPTKHYWQHRVSETGGYAHLIAACADYVMLLDGKNDWTLAWAVQAPAK